MSSALGRVKARLTRPRIRSHDVFIVGTAYSGSTLLGNALNGHCAIHHLGEVSRLPAFGIGDPIDRCVLCTAAGRPCPLWTPELLAEVQQAGPSQVHSVVRRRLGGTPILVDGSKSLEWLARCIDGDGSLTSPFVLVSVRHPFAFADTCRRRVSMTPSQSARLWRDAMSDTMASLAMWGLGHLVVRYEDLARDPQWVLGRVVDTVGVDPQPGLTEFWDHDAHMLGGNAGAHMRYEPFRRSGRFLSDADRRVAESYADRPFGGWVDDKWTEALSAADLDAIASTPRLGTVASMFGYDVSPTAAGR